MSRRLEEGVYILIMGSGAVMGDDDDEVRTASSSRSSSRSSIDGGRCTGAFGSIRNGGEWRELRWQLAQPVFLRTAGDRQTTTTTTTIRNRRRLRRRRRGVRRVALLHNSGARSASPRVIGRCCVAKMLVLKCSTTAGCRACHWPRAWPNPSTRKPFLPETGPASVCRDRPLGCLC